MQNFEKLIHLLAENKVDFVIIGGFAAVVHGVSTLTQDIDICISFDKKNAERVLVAIKDCNPVHRQNKKPVKETPETFARYKNLYLLTDLGPLDLLGQVSGLGSFENLFNHTIEIELFCKKCRVLDIDALIESKKEMGRPKDKEVIIQLTVIKEKKNIP